MMKLPKLQGRNMQVLLHIAAWAVILGLPLYSFMRLNFPNVFLWALYINIVVNGLIFYGNYLVLIPRYFFNKRRVRYYISVTALILVLFFISHLAYTAVFSRANFDERSDRLRSNPRVEKDEPPPPQRERRTFGPFGPMQIYNYVFTSLGMTIFALGLRSLERHSLIEKRQKELEKEKLNAELAFLKGQISPHFFFNTLNNIYALIGINTEDSQTAVLKLSRMMRYLLYESESGETQLSSEIDFMNNYIDLMRLRMSEKVKLDVSFPSNYENMIVPPLLFISVIENAFKHGISYREKSFIDIAMEVSKECITFRCANSIVNGSDVSVDKHTGIGLDNLSKRLNLLYPDKHELTIDREGSVFKVLVKIFTGKA